MNIELRLTHYFRDAFSIFKMILSHKLPYNETPVSKYIHIYMGLGQNLHARLDIWRNLSQIQT